MQYIFLAILLFTLVGCANTYNAMFVIPTGHGGFKQVPVGQAHDYHRPIEMGIIHSGYLFRVTRFSAYPIEGFIGEENFVGFVVVDKENPDEGKVIPIQLASKLEYQKHFWSLHHRVSELPSPMVVLENSDNGALLHHFSRDGQMRGAVSFHGQELKKRNGEIGPKFNRDAALTLLSSEKYRRKEVFFVDVDVVAPLVEKGSREAFEEEVKAERQMREARERALRVAKGRQKSAQTRLLSVGQFVCSQDNRIASIEQLSADRNKIKIEELAQVNRFYNPEMNLMLDNDQLPDHAIFFTMEQLELMSSERVGQTFWVSAKNGGWLVCDEELPHGVWARGL